ncbi:hypothetical protein BC834DRAFT_969334 [Gloeopeniophorella convolvens]|nr:hypothetical protein BC834DRAFT_969334 [Gloeopeniophorella convolvens]
MPVAVALWSVVAKPGEPVSVIPQGDLVITNAALGAELADPAGRTTVKLTYTRPIKVTSDNEDEEGEDDEAALVEVVLCSLTPGRIEQALLNLTFEEDDEFLLEIVGKNEVHLSGNYVDQSPDQVPYNGDSDEDDEGDYALDEVSSDVEMNPEDMLEPLSGEDDDEDAGRFEEVPSDAEPQTAKAAKRPRESDVAEPEAAVGEKVSKKKAKKLKAENGNAAPPPADDGEAGKKRKDKKGKKSAENKEGETKQDNQGGLRELPNGLKIQDAKIGDGPAAKKGMRISMRYVGKLANGKVFDSNTKGKPFTFRLGAAEVIKGWDDGIAGMKVGGERLLIIPPALGYGNRKTEGIPAGSTLKFEVKLIDMK